MAAPSSDLDELQIFLLKGVESIVDAAFERLKADIRNDIKECREKVDVMFDQMHARMLKLAEIEQEQLLPVSNEAKVFDDLSVTTYVKFDESLLDLPQENCLLKGTMMEAAGSGIPTGDKLVLRGLKFHGFHGVKPEEKTLGQKFVIDVDAWMDLRSAGKSDDLSDTLSYTAIYCIVKEVVEGKSQNLLESVAEMIASKIFTNHPQISAVRVQVGKPHVAVPGSLDYLGVEIIRYRSIDSPNRSSTYIHAYIMYECIIL